MELPKPLSVHDFQNDEMKFKKFSFSIFPLFEDGKITGVGFKLWFNKFVHNWFK